MKTRIKPYVDNDLPKFITGNGGSKALNELLRIIKEKFEDDGFAIENASILIKSSQIDVAILEFTNKFREKK